MPAAESKVERAPGVVDPRVPTQRVPYAKDVPPVRRVPAPRKRSSAWWVIPGIVGTACAASGIWLLSTPLLTTGSGMDTTQVDDCVPQHHLFDVHVGMTKQAVVSTFSGAGQIDHYTPGESLEVVYRSCAQAVPWTRLLWVAYAWEGGEWRVAELHKGLGIVDAP